MQGEKRATKSMREKLFREGRCLCCNGRAILLRFQSESSTLLSTLLSSPSTPQFPMVWGKIQLLFKQPQRHQMVLRLCQLSHAPQRQTHTSECSCRSIGLLAKPPYLKMIWYDCVGRWGNVWATIGKVQHVFKKKNKNKFLSLKIRSLSHLMLTVLLT